MTISDQDLSDLRHSNRHDSQVVTFKTRHGECSSTNVNALTDDLIDARAALAKSEVECAALREALKRVKHSCQEMHTREGDDAAGIARAALAGTAGADMVADLKAERRELVERGVRAGVTAEHERWCKCTGTGSIDEEERMAIAARVLAEEEK